MEKFKKFKSIFDWYRACKQGPPAWLSKISLIAKLKFDKIMLKFKKKKYSIKKENFLGHSDIAPLRKSDPGEKFPWKKLSKYNLGKWYKKKKPIKNKFRNK